MNLPDRIFFTGVPGSRWSGIAQTLEQNPEFNTSDRSDARTYFHNGFSGHKGAYFGRMMEFDAVLDSTVIDSAWTKPGGCRLVKSHDWAYKLYRLKDAFPSDWIMLVYRPDNASFGWWKQAGGFDIRYPNYASYHNDEIMKREISWQNQAILNFAKDKNLTWESFDTQWIEKNFNYSIVVEKVWPDIQVTILK